MLFTFYEWKRFTTCPFGNWRKIRTRRDRTQKRILQWYNQKDSSKIQRGHANCITLLFFLNVVIVISPLTSIIWRKLSTVYFIIQSLKKALTKMDRQRLTMNNKKCLGLYEHEYLYVSKRKYDYLVCIRCKRVYKLWPI